MTVRRHYKGHQFQFCNELIAVFSQNHINTKRVGKTQKFLMSKQEIYIGGLSGK